MGLSDFAKTKAPEKTTATSRRARREDSSAKTFATAQMMTQIDLDKANTQLEEYADSLPVRELDPNDIGFTKYANRHESHFEGKEFAALCADIAESGSNAVPIMVRSAKNGGANTYEVVYGHRRLRACQHAGTKVRALIEDVTDEAMFAYMVRENNEREDLSPYEEAVSYQKALDNKLYRTQQALAAAIGVSNARISQVMTLAKLPQEVLGAFSSPTQISYRWAVDLLSAMQDDRRKVLRVAKELAVHEPRFSDKAVFDRLVGATKPIKQEIKVSGKTQATITSDAGLVKVSFAKHSLTEAQTEQLKILLEGLLADAT